MSDSQDLSSQNGQERRAQTYLEALTGSGDQSKSDNCHSEQLTSRSISPSLTSSPRPFIPRSKGRSVSFSLDSLSGATSSLLSPLHGREHASESGSPTLEQVLLMGRQSQNSTDAGYGSFSSPRPRSNSKMSYNESPSDADSPPVQFQTSARPTVADVVGIDMAVAQAVQNLQYLQQQQATMWGGGQSQGFQTPGLNELDLPPINQLPSNSMLNSNQLPSNSMLNSILASVTRPTMEHGDQHRDPLALERAARLYRSAASVYEASCTWSGRLPPRSSTAGPNSSYSTKIFLGGVPWDISEQTLVQAFAEFGEVRVEWPGRDYTAPPRGYLYLVFQDETNINDLLSKCSQDYNSRDSYYYRISSRRMRSKEVQIIPWVIADSNYVRCASPRLDPQKTVFVGALHGMMTAQGLAVVFNDLFGGVVYSGLDTDKYKYPIGSGRVTFNNSRSYMKAVAAAFIEIKTPRFSKKVQVDPYLEDTLCSVCSMKQGPYFCRDLSCFNYFCHGCWDLHHTNTRHHKPLMRNIRGLTRARTSHQDQPGYTGGRLRPDPVRDLTSRFGEAFGLNY